MGLPSVRRPWLLAYVVLLAVLILLHLGTAQSSWRPYAAYTAASVLAAAVATDGVRRNRPARRAGWQLTAAALWLHAANAVTLVAQAAFPQLRWLLFTEIVAALALHACALGAAVSFLAARRPGRDRNGLIDAVTVVVAGALLVWQWRERQGSWPVSPTQATPVVVTLLMAATLSVGLRLYLAKSRPVGFLLLLAGATVSFLGNLIVITSPAGAGPAPGVEALWLIGVGLVAMSAQLPDMRLLAEPEPADDAEPADDGEAAGGGDRAGGGDPEARATGRPPRPAYRPVSAYRTVGLGAALLVNPALVALAGADGTSYPELLAAGVTVLTTLVLWRIARMVREREGMRERLAAQVRERDVLQERLQHQAGHDALTGLPNRASFLAGLDVLDARGRADGSIRPHPGREGANLPVGEGRTALLFVDLDGFKAVNDAFGHAVGDELLVAVAARLRACLRAGDTAARLGGDEFVALVDCSDGDRAATVVAERVLEALSRPFGLGTGLVSIGASIGIAYADPVAGPRAHPGGDGRCDATSLLRRADAAMYAAKRSGRNRYHVWSAPAVVLPESSRRDPPAVDSIQLSG